MPTATLQLKQTKQYVGPLRFAVRHEVSEANPGLLATPFVVNLSSNPYDKERLVRVATLEDLVLGDIPVRALNSFFDAVPITAVAGDTVVIKNPPPEWGLSGASLSYKVVTTIPGRGGVVVDRPFWWSIAQPAPDEAALAWELWRVGGKVQEGTHGWTERDGGDGLCLTDRFQAMFSEGETGLNHLMAVQSWVHSLLMSAGLDGSQFEQFAPGNPVVTRFSR